MITCVGDDHVWTRPDDMDDASMPPVWPRDQQPCVCGEMPFPREQALAQAQDEMSLRPRPGETPQDTVDRVMAVARPEPVTTEVILPQTASEIQDALESGPFQVYILRPGVGPASVYPTRVASCDGDSLGAALLQLLEDGELDGAAVGVKYQHADEETGRWLINPWAGRSRP